MYEGAQKALKDFGTNAGEILFAVPTLVGSTPLSSNRDSPSVQIIIRGIQRGLNKLGGGLDVSGVIDARTESGLQFVSGSEYRDKKWIELYSDISVAIRMGSRLTKSSVVVSAITTPWIWVAASGLGAYLLLRK